MDLKESLEAIIDEVGFIPFIESNEAEEYVEIFGGNMDKKTQNALNTLPLLVNAKGNHLSFYKLQYPTIMILKNYIGKITKKGPILRDKLYVMLNIFHVKRYMEGENELKEREEFDNRFYSVTLNCANGILFYLEKEENSKFKAYLIKEAVYMLRFMYNKQESLYGEPKYSTIVVLGKLLYEDYLNSNFKDYKSLEDAIKCFEIIHEKFSKDNEVKNISDIVCLGLAYCDYAKFRHKNGDSDYISKDLLEISKKYLELTSHLIIAKGGEIPNNVDITLSFVNERLKKLYQ